MLYHDCTTIGGSCFIRYLSYNPLTAPVTAASTIKRIHLWLEVDTLFLTGTAQHKERQDCQHHTYPLIQIEPLAEYKHGSPQVPLPDALH